MEFLPFPDKARCLSELDVEDETFITVLIQKRLGEVNDLEPADYYDVYLVRSGQFIQLWSFRSLKDFIHLVKHGNNQEPLKEQPIITWLTQVLYPLTLPEQNRSAFVRRMKAEGFTF